ncbi:MAG: Heparinase family protein, partial [Paenibacillus sp.]|nr:Heparinase family protein [Paenibacillus sp.]
MRDREQTDHNKWRAHCLEQLEQELERLLQEGYAIPSEPGGWWHQYVCPEHHIELEFDPFEQDAHTFHCPYGCSLEGEPYRGGWLVYKHQQLARCALQAAAVYAGTRERRFAELGKQIIGQYAHQFPKYP